MSWEGDEGSEVRMAVELMVLLKVKLLAAGGHCHLHVALLWFFLLKLPLAVRMRGSYADMVLTLRLFFFRLNRVLLSDVPLARNGRQWERAVRLIQERMADGGRSDGQATEDSLHALSMIAM